MLFVDNINNYKPVEWISRDISSLHTIICSISSILYIFDFININLWSKFLCVTIYFCIQDLYLVTLHYNYFNKMYLETLIHHTIFIILILNYEYFKKTLAIGILSEISTLVLNRTWMLYQMKLTKSYTFKLYCILLLILFFIFRIINFTCMFIYYYPIENIFIYKNILFIIVILNYYWFYKLCIKFKSF
jgi:hypothetical protein